jgi:hypothetical protein
VVTVATDEKPELDSLRRTLAASGLGALVVLGKGRPYGTAGGTKLALMEEWLHAPPPPRPPFRADASEAAPGASTADAAASAAAAAAAEANPSFAALGLSDDTLVSAHCGRENAAESLSGHRYCRIDKTVCNHTTPLRFFNLKKITCAIRKTTPKVLFVDAYDVLVMPTAAAGGWAAELQQRFARFNATVVVSGETGCWPDPAVAPALPWPHFARQPHVGSLYRPPNATARAAAPAAADAGTYPGEVPFPYPNSGGYVGRAGDLRAMARRVMDDVRRGHVAGGGTVGNADDQRWLQRHWLKHPHEVRQCSTLPCIQPLQIYEYRRCALVFSIFLNCFLYVSVSFGPHLVLLPCAVY